MRLPPRSSGTLCDQGRHVVPSCAPFVYVVSGRHTTPAAAAVSALIPRREDTVRRTDVFFYGLFMDEDALRAKGLEPRDADRASVEGFELRIGERAALVPKPDSTVHGLVISLSLAEVG